MIISELQGGENDPEQLLDTEVTAAAFKVHPYHHPTIGWLSDLRDDDARGSVRALPPLLRALERHAGRSSATSTPTMCCERVKQHFGGIAPGSRPARVRQVEPPQQAERRVVLRKEGTTAYWKAAFHAPAFADEAFFPLLVADAVLNGAAGLNIWSMGGVSRPQRSARLYRALVDGGLASTRRAARCCRPSIRISTRSARAWPRARRWPPSKTPCSRRSIGCGATASRAAELAKVKAQLRARFVYDADSVTDIAHQLGYFETIGVVARLSRSSRRASRP